MKLVRWKRFTWHLNPLPPLAHQLPESLLVRTATREEEKDVTHLVFRAFTLDSTWGDTLKIFRERLELGIHAAFAREAAPAIVVAHGPRIIAASVLNSEEDAESNLLSGPCVLPEYCNRGIGSALLHASLNQLREAGLATAHAVTKDNVPAAKFVYSKFGSTSAAHDYEPLLAGP
jgi:N-acetylglutamate synthase-like GNAT family acetyltransferase